MGIWPRWLLFVRGRLDAMKIAVLLARFSVTGMPMAQLRLARALAAAGHDVDLIVGYSDPALVIPDVPGVRRLVLDRPKTRTMLGPLRTYLRSTRPEVVFSAEDHLNTVVLAAAVLSGSMAKISGSSHVSPFGAYSNRPFTKRWFLKQFSRLLFRRADALTCVSEDMVDQYRRLFSGPPHVCVHNIVDDADTRARISEPLEDGWFFQGDLPLVIGAGGLEPWKGFGDLIEAIAILDSRGKRVRVAILGEGSLRNALQAQIARLGLSETVRLVGRVENVFKYFAHADVFALSSHFEGLPTVLVEAMMSGCTPVATDCPTGPREVLQDGRYGYLVPIRDPAALAAGIESAIDAPIDPALLAEAVTPFAAQAVLDRHFEILGIRP